MNKIDAARKLLRHHGLVTIHLSDFQVLKQMSILGYYYDEEREQWTQR